MKDQRQNIIDAAVKLFEKRGYRGTTMDDLASAVGLTKPAIYHYFDSKVDILRAIVERWYHLLEHELNSVFSLQLPPRQKLEKAIIKWVEHVCRYSSDLRIFINERKELTLKERRWIYYLERRILDEFRQVYEDGVRNGDFTDTHSTVTSLLMIGACNALFHWYKKSGNFGPEHMARSVTNLLFNGCLAKKMTNEKTEVNPTNVG